MSAKTLTCFAVATSLSQWMSPKLHNELNLSVWLSSVWWKPSIWEEGHRGFSLLWAVCFTSLTGATLLTHTGGNGSYENGTEKAGHQVIAMLQLHFLLIVIPAALKRLWKLGYRRIYSHEICTMQQDVTLHNIVRTVSKRLYKEKSWYKKVTLRAISISRSTEDVLHCNPVLGFQGSRGLRLWL